MASLRRAAVLLAAVVALSAALAAGGPQAAQANVACDVAGAVAAPVTGAATRRWALSAARSKTPSARSAKASSSR